jgi:hypothetical protein
MKVLDGFRIALLKAKYPCMFEINLILEIQKFKMQSVCYHKTLEDKKIKTYRSSDLILRNFSQEL